MIDKEKLNALNEYLKKEKLTKKEWLESKVDETLKK